MIRPFGFNEFLFILSAVQWTLALSAIAFAGGAIGGLASRLPARRTSSRCALRGHGFIQLFQGTPLLMQLFLVFFGATMLGLDINPWIAAALALTLNASAFLGEIWRGCIEAVPARPVGSRDGARPALSRPHALRRAAAGRQDRRRRRPSASWCSSSRAPRSPRSSASPR